ncbi:phosphate ABC transporter, permease protein PstA, partial [Bacillus thuringiensis]|nr:phosphate ABC transporter, permease protein PstA [Bacillus thuringiensis]
MDAKKRDKLATAIIYIFVGIVVLILAGILGNILITGIPHLSWYFLTSEASSY